jgi:hypothetical protein
MRLVAQQLFGLSLVLLWGVVVGHSAEFQPAEYQLKAAFMFNFAKFITWPPEAFAETNSPFRFGVLGQNPFGDDLDRLVRNKSLGGHPLTVERPGSVAEARKCHVLFISTSEENHLRQILDDLRGSTVLTVGETSRFVESGGIIGFVIESQKIHFEINSQEASRAGLKVSSKLLSLAMHPSH